MYAGPALAPWKPRNMLTSASRDLLLVSSHLVVVVVLLLLWFLPQVADRLNAAGVPCNLVTGQEVRRVPGARHTACTVEMVDLDHNVEVGSTAQHSANCSD